MAAAQDDARLDSLFSALLEADAETAPAIVNDIVEEWSRSGSPTIDLLLKRGRDALESGDYAAAIDHFTAVIDYAPDFAEGYNGRALAYYNTERIGPAIDDLRQTLVLNPRHFFALIGFATVLEELGRPEDALEVYNLYLALHPSSPEANEAAERLTNELAGRSL